MPFNSVNQPILSVAQMRDAENALMADGVSVHELMQRAGRGAGQIIWQIGGTMPTNILCGPGNNGGDGYVIAQFLLERGVPVTAIEVMPATTLAAKRAQANYEGRVVALVDAQPSLQCIDCLFGSGLTRPIEEARWQACNALLSAAKLRIAVDVPSGVEADSGTILNQLPTYTHVIALGAWKYAHFLAPSAAIMGQKLLVGIGIEPPPHAAHRIAKPGIAAPDYAAHKYQRGKLVIVAGEMPGAAQLVALAAQSAGAGYVELLTPQPMTLPASIVQRSYAGAGALADMLADPRISAIVAGPGLGRDAQAHAVLATVLASDKPILLDADALHLLPEHDHAACNAPIIVTPHAGEFRALAGQMVLRGSKVEQVREMAARLGLYVLAKGPDTVLASPQGETLLADAASSWLSVAGSGDVLAGTIAARLATGVAPLDAMAQGQWLHARAARLAGPAFDATELSQQIRFALAECV